MISTYVHVSAYKYNDIYLIFAHNDMKIGGGGEGQYMKWNQEDLSRVIPKGFRLK